MEWQVKSVDERWGRHGWSADGYLIAKSDVWLLRALFVGGTERG